MFGNHKYCQWRENSNCHCHDIQDGECVIFNLQAMVKYTAKGCPRATHSKKSVSRGNTIAFALYSKVININCSSGVKGEILLIKFP